MKSTNCQRKRLSPCFRPMLRRSNTRAWLRPDSCHRPSGKQALWTQVWQHQPTISGLSHNSHSAQVCKHASMDMTRHKSQATKSKPNQAERFTSAKIRWRPLRTRHFPENRTGRTKMDWKWHRKTPLFHAGSSSFESAAEQLALPTHGFSLRRHPG